MVATDYPDYEGGKQRVYLVPEWAALNAVDKDLYKATNNLAAGMGSSGVYTVTAGKTLYITDYTWSISANVAADRELNQMGVASIIDNTAGTTFVIEGGNGGGGASLNKPIIIPANHIVGYGVLNASNHACDIRITAHGYEV